MLTDERIAQALQLLTTDPAMQLDPIELAAPQHLHNDDLCRLMEIYCVVKSGGVQTQIEAAQALLTREGAKMLTEIDLLTSQQAEPATITLIQQEHRDLERSIAWRIAYLEAISPLEEAVVTTWADQIEQVLRNKAESLPLDAKLDSDTGLPSNRP